MSTTVFLSYARGDDGEPFDPGRSFVARLQADLTARGFDVWFDQVSMPSRRLTFHQEIRDAIAARERLVLVVGPRAVTSDYVRQEWQFAWREADKVVTPILRLGDYPLVPDELKLLHCEDFRDDNQYPFHLENLARQLREPTPPLGKLIAVPSLPAHYLQRGERLQALRGALRADLDRPVVIGGAAARVGMHGMGGIGKSVLAAALARDRKVREAFPDGIVWVGLGSLPDLRALMQQVHRGLGGDGAIPTEHEGKQRLKELLAEKAVLLVLDDAWRRSDVDTFDVLGSRCRALVTTRDAGLLTSLGGTHHVVELLTDQEARHLLATAAGVTEEDLPVEATALVAECGRLPLAVALCGGMIRRGLRWGNVLQQLQRARIDRISDRHAVEPQHQSIWHAVHFSVEALGTAERERFLEMGVFPPNETTPERAIATLWEHTSQLDDWGTAEHLTTLAERSLIQMTLPVPGSDHGQRRFSLHDLVYDYVQRAIPEPPDLHVKLLAAYAKKCQDGWHTGPNDGYFFDHLAHHLESAGHKQHLTELLGDSRWLCSRMRASSIGIAGLDSILFGDVEQSSGPGLAQNIMLVEGPPGSGKTVFALQLFMRLVTWGSRCLLVTTDYSEATARQLLRRVRLSNSYMNDEDTEGLQTPELIASVDALTVKDCSETRASNLFLASLPTIIPHDVAAVLIDDVPNQGDVDRTAVASLVRYFCANNILAILVCEKLSESDNGRTRSVFEYVSDVFIELGHRPESDYSTRTIEVMKNRGHRSKRGRYTFSITRSRKGDDGVEIVVHPHRG